MEATDTSPEESAATLRETVTRVPRARDITLGGIRTLRRKPKRGATLPTVRLVQPKARIDEKTMRPYARLCGFTPEQGVPPTWPHILAFPLHMALLMRSDFPYPMIGLVHLRNRIRQYERLSCGNVLELEVGFGGFVAHPRGQAFLIEVQARRDGSLVWGSTSTYLRRGVHDAQGEPEQGQRPGPQPMRIAARLRLPADLGRRYAAVAGDSNPIHTSRLGARLLGFRRPLAHGMWNAARALAATLPQSPVATLDYDTAFKVPAFLPSNELVLTTQDRDTTIIDVCDRTAAKPHLRGVLTYTV